MTPDANDLCVFAVKRGDIEKRIDSYFYLPIFQSVINSIKKKPFYQLEEIATFSKETTDFSEFLDGTFEYLEISGVSLKTNKYRTSTINVADAPSRAKMRTEIDDIAISLTRPHRGAITIVDEKGIIASTGFSIIRNTKPDIDKKWLLFTLISDACLKQMLQRSSGGNYPAIIEEELKHILIPQCSLAEQKKMVAGLEGKLQLLNSKIQQANELLRKNPIYLIDRLGLSFDFSDTQKLSYATSAANIEGRIDADFYSPKFAHFRKQIEALPYQTVSIGEISEKIVSGFAAGKQDQADDLPDEQRVPHLRPFSITPEGELSLDTKKYVPRAGLKDSDYCKKYEVIFNNTNSPEWVGKTTVFDSDDLCAASNHMTRISVKEGVNPYYVAYFFNLLLSIGYWKLLCTNFNNQAGVNTDTLKAVRIPLPEKPEQDQIVAEIMQRRSEANRLRIEANTEWKAARAQFEKELLGE